MKMAAAMLGSSRCLSRSLSTLTVGRLGLAKHKARICPKQLQTVSEKQARTVHHISSLQYGGSRISGLDVSYSHTFGGLSHGLHTTSAVWGDDVQVVMPPPFADSVSEGDIRWEKAVGDSVAEDEVVGEIETDKTALPVTAPAAGVIEELLVEDGGRVEQSTQLFKLRLGAVGAPAAAAPPPAAEAAPPAAAPEPAAAPAAAAAPSSAAGPIPTTPPPVSPLPTAPMSSTPTAAVKATPAAPAAASGAAAPAAPGSRAETRVKMNRMRQRIAQRLKDSQNTCAMLTTFNEVDMSNIMELRKTYKEDFLKKHGIKLGFMSAFVKAAAFALQDQPVVNAVIDEKEIVYRDYIDISVAVATPKGLVVPVLRNVENLSYAGIERYLNELGEKARKNELAVEDMDGGTFTVSNGGVFGSMMGTPIINLPQSAILGMHGVFERPVAIKGKVEIRPMMYIALTYDHRLIDGREAVFFLRKIKSAVEDPRVLLLEL